MSRCRNCGNAELQDLGFIGQLAPFFLKRVFAARIGPSFSPHPLKRFIQRASALPQALLHRVSQPFVFVEMQLCEDCSFLQTRQPFQEEAINRLYVDYRADTYNRERIEYEPSYAAVVEQVGQDEREQKVRVTAATKFLKTYIQPGPDFTILDYGGADGKFLPDLPGRKFVFEISNIEPIAGVTRVHTEAEMGTYSLVQLTHVIEHVVQPLELVKFVANKVAPGGYLYLETPQELTDEIRAQLKSATAALNISIHEHINSYSVKAVSRLMESAGLRLVAIEATEVDVGWATAVHIRALGQR